MATMKSVMSNISVDTNQYQQAQSLLDSKQANIKSFLQNQPFNQNILTQEYRDALKEGFKGTEEDYKTLRDYT